MPKHGGVVEIRAVGTPSVADVCSCVFVDSLVVGFLAAGTCKMNSGSKNRAGCTSLRRAPSLVKPFCGVFRGSLGGLCGVVGGCLGGRWGGGGLWGVVGGLLGVLGSLWGVSVGLLGGL